MLQNMRAHAQGWIAWVIAGVLCIAFALWGIEYYIGGGQKHPPAASVNGQDISQNQWDASYDRLLQSNALAQQDATNSDLQKQFKAQALRSLVEEAVLTQAAAKTGYIVNMQQILSLIANFPEFQINGQFSPDLFKRIARQAFGSEQAILKNIQDRSSIVQVRTGIVGTAFALPEEVNRLLALANEKRDIHYITIPASQFLDTAKVSDEEIAQYYQAHSSDFMTKEALSLQYIVLSPDNAAAKVSVSPEEIAQYARGDLASAGSSTTSTAQATVEQDLKQQKIAQLLATESEQLAQLTFTHPDSLEPAASALGLKIETTPLFGREGSDALPALLSNPKVLAVAFSDNVLTERNNSDVISLDNTHAIVIRVADYKPSVARPLKEVRNDIENKLKYVAASKMAQAEAQKIVTTLKANTAKQEAVPVSWQTVSGLTRQPRSDLADTLIKRAFSLPAPQEGKLSIGMASIANGDAAVITLKKVIPGDVSTISAEEREKARETLAAGMGEMEYFLYVAHHVNEAKIKTIDN
jgi:peptidyl-prolyl cis-trans isomerase D